MGESPPCKRGERVRQQHRATRRRWPDLVEQPTGDSSVRGRSSWTWTDRSVGFAAVAWPTTTRAPMDVVVNNGATPVRLRRRAVERTEGPATKSNDVSGHWGHPARLGRICASIAAATLFMCRRSAGITAFPSPTIGIYHGVEVGV